MSNLLSWKRKAMLMGAGRIPSGIIIGGCLAAYRFDNAWNETEALHDLTEHGYNLYKVNDPAWNRDIGYTISEGKGLQNTTLWGLSPVSVVAAIGSSTTPTESLRAAQAISGSSNNGNGYTRCLFLQMPYSNAGGYYVTAGGVGAYMRNGIERNDSDWMKPRLQEFPESGVIGAVYNGVTDATIYIDENATTYCWVVDHPHHMGAYDAATPGSLLSEASLIVGSQSTGGSSYMGTYTIKAISLYDRQLTYAEYLSVMHAMKGILS